MDKLWKSFLRTYPFVSERAREQFRDMYQAAEERYWRMPFEDFYVETKAGRTHIRAAGPEEGRPVLLFPGITMTSLVWAPNALALARHFRIYAVDPIYDFGLSEPRRLYYTRRAMVEWIHDIVRGLGLSRASLVGHSYGGWLSAEFALAHPDEAASIVLIAPGATISPMSRYFLALCILTIAYPGEGAKRVYRYTLRDAMEYNDAAYFDFPSLLRFERLCFSAYRRRIPADPRVLTAEDWSRLTLPVLLIIGRHEKLYDPATVMDSMAARAPHVKRLLVEGAGHDVCLVKAQEVNEAILRFLGEKI